MINRSSAAICTCTNQGKPWLLDGVSVVSYNPGCRVHSERIVIPHASIVERKEITDWTRRERDK
jgi:hypothetical protein